MKITKRNGIRVDFDKSKIISAITRANEAIDKKNRITEEDIVSIANKIEDKVKGKRKLTVENVQEMIEFELMEIKAFEIAKILQTEKKLKLSNLFSFISIQREFSNSKLF